MSWQSQAIFDKALREHQPDADPAVLRKAAVGHLGASRPLNELVALYAEAMADGDHTAAQALADELAPVRAAQGVAAGVLPSNGG